MDYSSRMNVSVIGRGDMGGQRTADVTPETTAEATPEATPGM
jgi:hypothetical protein